ncbi:hypothetical protein QL285_015520 [Trifolium repens]|nr:hypothetical protein QL285_015520 [Trifolium repens]
MASNVASLIDTLRSLLLQDHEDLMDDYEDFASMVTNLRDYSWQLTPPQHEFLDCLLSLRDRMIKDFPFISAVEESRCHSQRTNAAIFDEMWLVKEGMRMYESTLAASFDEEDSIEHQLAKMQMEIEQLKEKKRKHVSWRETSGMTSPSSWRNVAHYWSFKIANEPMPWTPLMFMAIWRSPENVAGKLANFGIMLGRPPTRPSFYCFLILCVA